MFKLYVESKSNQSKNAILLPCKPIANICIKKIDFAIKHYIKSPKKIII